MAEILTSSLANKSNMSTLASHCTFGEMFNLKYFKRVKKLSCYKNNYFNTNLIILFRRNAGCIVKESA
jgi:hypothetical protein